MTISLFVRLCVFSDLFHAANFLPAEVQQIDKMAQNNLAELQKKVIPENVRETRLITKRLEVIIQMVRKKWKDVKGKEVKAVCATMGKEDATAKKVAKEEAVKKSYEAPLVAPEIAPDPNLIRDEDIDIEEVAAEVEEFWTLRQEGDLGEKQAKEAMRCESKDYFLMKIQF